MADSRADMKDRTQKGSNSPEGSADFTSLAYAETSSRPSPLKKSPETLPHRSHGSSRELYRVRGAEKQASESMADPPAGGGGGGGGLGRLREDKQNGGRELSRSDEDGMQQQKKWVEWDRFLPQRQLRVLLVENDDSTRHVVAALLRKCSYEVSCACNGLEAWEILNDPSNHFDLALTEVVMPCMSGIALLCKIMSHEAYKHIPVIMMSAHDSMGIVFKCLSKGAVDFLVKPVRKNELKNLWQHVWRRCQSSSGSGSGSGTETLDVPQPKSGGSAASGGNNTGSNDGNDNVSSDVNVLDGSDNGSGTQSSWTKRAVEIESPRCRAAVQEQPVTATKVEKPRRIPAVSGIAIADGQAVQREIDANMGQDAEVVMQKVPHYQLQNAKDKMKPTNSICALKQDASSTDSREREQVYEVPVVDTGTIRSRGPSIKASDLKYSEACINKERDEEQGESGLIVEKNIPPSQNEKGDSCSALLESALKRPRTKHMQGEVQERLTLRHSGSSAFSRYNASSNVTLPLSGVSSKGIIRPQGVGCVGYGVGCSSGSGMSKPTEVAGSSKGSANIHSQPSGSINNNPMGFSGAGKDELLQGMAFPLPPRGIHSPNHALFLSHSNTPQLVAPMTSPSPQNTNKGASFDPSLVGLDEHSHSHAHHYHHPPSSSSHQSKPSKDNNLKPQREEVDMSRSRVHMANGTTEVMNGQSGSSNNYGYVSAGNGSGSINRSATGSNTNDGHNLVSLMSARNSVTMASNEGDQIRVAIREAALTKFRQKRKERCYGKKVRYQSRKKLAEQRPRVRGQFVRQNVYTGGEEE